MDATTLHALKTYAEEDFSAIQAAPKGILKLEGGKLVHVNKADLTIWDTFLHFLGRFGIGSYSLNKIADYIGQLSPNQDESSLYKKAVENLLSEVRIHNSKFFVRHVSVDQLAAKVNKVAEEMGIKAVPQQSTKQESPHEQKSVPKDEPSSLSPLEASPKANTPKEPSPSSPPNSSPDTKDVMTNESSGLTIILEIALQTDDIGILYDLEGELSQIPASDPAIENMISIVSDAIAAKREELLGETTRKKVSIELGNGIQNGGNSCYLNALIQALRFAGVENLYEEREGVKGTREGLEGILHTINNRTLHYQEINDFRRFLITECNFSSLDEEYSQEDACEALLALFNALGTHTFTFSYYNSDQERFFEDVGNLISVSVHGTSLQEAINQEEITLIETPTILPILLKRYETHGKAEKKITTPVQPDKNIVVSGKNYELVSMVVHQGSSLNRGHYFSHVPQANGTWVTFNDSQVSQQKTMPDDAAYDGYIFFYRLVEQ